MAQRVGSAARYLAELVLGGPTRRVSTNFVVGSTFVVVAKNNPDRVGLVIQNIGSTDAFANFTSDILSALGYKLTQLGGALTMQVRDDFELPTEEWKVITQGASTSIQVLEVIADIIRPQETT